jgi:two-component system phosphate regulon sensor histidine kinase PhoR
VPLEEMEKGANRFASGDLDYRLPVWGAEELVSLGETMNRMAARVGERIRTITQEKNEIETVLSSMDEAVLVMDMNERIIRFNQAAACLFDVTPSTAQDRSIQEVIRNTDLQRLVTKTLSTQEPQGSPVAVEGDIILYNGSERFLQAHGTILRDLKGEKLGALIVLNDITRLKVLENVRRDFVANVSHELKTPITSIKGFVETLKEGAMNYPEDRIRFLDIIARHADRLNAIIEDLLSLSRIEQDAEREQIVLSDERIKEAIDSAILVCSAKAHEKGIKIDLTCDEGLKAKINLPLLEQAVVNLIDNAIKYSGPEGTIRIEAAKIGQETIIKVCDWGCGIPKEHLPRIFERFYRVDKARSRKLGGTGLGLAIVKHIVHAHGGRITVESAPDKGSTFSICLPDC